MATMPLFGFSVRFNNFTTKDFAIEISQGFYNLGVAPLPTEMVPGKKDTTPGTLVMRTPSGTRSFPGGLFVGKPIRMGTTKNDMQLVDLYVIPTNDFAQLMRKPEDITRFITIANNKLEKTAQAQTWIIEDGHPLSVTQEALIAIFEIANKPILVTTDESIA